MVSQQPIPVLIIDDEEANRYTLSRYLQRKGFEVWEAATGEDGLRKAARRPEIIVLDVNLPDMVGYEVCRQLKSDPETRGIPVLQVSAAFTSGKDRVQGLSEGADAYLAEPIDPEELVATLNALLRVRRAEAEAEMNVANLEAVIGSMAEGLIMVDREGNIVHMNPAAVQINGFNSLDEVPKSAGDFIPLFEVSTLEGAVLPPEHWPLFRAVRGERVSNVEVRVRRTDTRKAWIGSYNASPLKTRKKGAELTIVTVFDITERKRAEEALLRHNQRLQLLTDAAEQMLSTEEPGHMVRDIFFELSPLLGLDSYAVMLTDAQGALQLQASQGWSTADLENLLRHPQREAFFSVSGEMRPKVFTFVQQSVEPAAAFLQARGVRCCLCYPMVAENQLLGTLIFASHTHDEWPQEELKFLKTLCHYMSIAYERAAHVRHLEEQVAERTARLSETIGQLESFSYSISHDMRAPLRAMQQFSQILVEDFGNDLPAEGQKYLGRISAAASRLDKLIQDVLVYSRVSRAQVEITRVDLNKVVAEILQHSSQVQQANADVQVASPLHPVLAHEASLIQAISNLIGNAVKFVAPGVRPEVKIWTEKHGEHVRVNVRDNGIGIAPENHHRIFNIFERVPGKQSYEGTGIGLSIVKKTVERMQGTIGLESAAGQGSRFWIQLPSPDEHFGADKSECDTKV